MFFCCVGGTVTKWDFSGGHFIYCFSLSLLFKKIPWLSNVWVWMCKYIYLSLCLSVYLLPCRKSGKWIFSSSLVIMFLPLQADEKGQHFLVPRQAVKPREISHSFLTDLQRMGIQGKCMEVHPAQNVLCISKKCRLGDINYCLPECWDKELTSVC